MSTVTAACAAGAASSSRSVARSTERTGAVRVATAVGLPARMRPRRTCHAVPGSSERFLAKAPTLDADEVFLDLEDAVAPSEKENARDCVIDALTSHDFGAKTVVVRVNGTDTPHYYRDLIDVVEQAGDRLHASCCPRSARPATSR